MFDRLYNAADYEHLAVSPEVKELFQYISRSVLMLFRIFCVNYLYQHVLLALMIVVCSVVWNVKCYS